MDDFHVVMLASGSKGNAALISTRSQRFLVDVGISCRALAGRLKEIGAAPEELDGVFLTHEHSDHVRGLATFLKKYRVPVYSSEKTWQAILAKEDSIDRRCCRLMGKSLLIGGVRVDSFAVPHDAADPHGYSFTQQDNGAKCTYLTDTGFITSTVREAVCGSQILILEANHDVEMLRNGDYPLELKRRILSTRGHLSNESAGRFLSELAQLPRHVILAHLSEHNNRPQLALDTIKNILDSGHRLQETEFFVASQNAVVADFPLQQPCLF